MAVKGWIMTAVAVAVAAGTYFTLETVYPPSSKGDVDLRLISPESVFGDAPADAGAVAGVAELTPAKTPDAADRALDEAMAPNEYDLRVTDEPLAADAAGAGAATPSPADEPAAAEQTPAPEDAAPIEDETTAGGQTEEAAAADDGAAPAMPTPAPSPAAPTAQPTPGPSPAATTPAPSPRPAVTPRATTKAPPTARPPAPQLTQWWGPESETRLSVVYAGSAAYTRAIVLMFNGAFRDAASAQQQLHVRDAAGKAVAGSWQVGASNRRMLLFPVARNGIYTVTVGAGLVDQNGRSVGRELQGPVRVQ